MLLVKTITNAWHTSSRMHEAEILPCLFGCNCLSNLTIAIPSTGSNSIIDETAHYLVCPILISIISDACHLEPRPSLHDLIYGNGTHDSLVLWPVPQPTMCTMPQNLVTDKMC